MKTIAEKLTYLNETKNQIKSSLGSTSEVFRDYVEDINYLNQAKNQLSSNQKVLQASGENINVTDSAETPCKISIDTNIKQDSREGYNLLEPIMKSATSNGVTCTNNGDGTFTLNGTSTAKSTFRLDQGNLGGTNNLKNYDDGDYEISLGITNSNLRLLVMQVNTWKSLLILPANTEKYHASMTNATDCFIYLDVYKDATFNNVVIKPMLRKYNNDVKPYEQYGSMPSIEFPSEIKTPVGKQSFVALDKISIKIDDVDMWEQGIIRSNDGENDDGTSYNVRIRLKEHKPISSDKDYFMYIDNNTTDIRIGNIHYYDEYKNFLTTQNAIDSLSPYKEVKLTPPSRTKYFRMTMLREDKVSAINRYTVPDTKLMLVEGTTKAENQTQDLDLNEELLGTIVDLTEEQATELGLDGEGSYFKDRYGRIVLDGSEEWLYNGTNVGYRYYLQDDINLYAESGDNIIPDILCDKFKARTMGETWRGNTGIASHYSATLDKHRLNFCYISDETDTLEKWKNWLSINKPEVVYPLRTKTYTKLTPEQQEQWNKIKKMHTYEGVTNIYIINEEGISPVLNLEYYMSINALTETILELGGSI